MKGEYFKDEDGYFDTTEPFRKKRSNRNANFAVFFASSSIPAPGKFIDVHYGLVNYAEEVRRAG